MSYGVNDKIAVEIELSEGEIAEAIPELKKEVDAIVAKLYPNRHGYMNGSLMNEPPSYESPTEWKQQDKFTVSQSSTPEETRIGDIVNDIKSCKDLTVLSSYKLIAKTKPEFQEAYDEMFEKLSNQNTTTK